MPIEPVSETSLTVGRTRGNARSILLSLFVLVALISIFWVPRFIPMAPSVSDSYIFGYNNRAGILLVVTFLAIGSFLFGRSCDAVPAEDDPAAIPNRVVAVWMLVFLLCAAGVYLLVRGVGGVGDSGYFIYRLKDLAAGKAPYTEFEFAYGPLLLYVPLTLMRVFGLDAETAYYIFLIVSTAAGVWLLAKIIELLDCPAERKKAIFVLFSLLSLPGLLWGVNHFLLRFIPPIYFALITDRIIRRQNNSRLVWGCVSAFAAAAITMLISPEQGTAFAFGCTSYLGLVGWRNGWLKSKPGSAIFLALCAAEAVIFWIAGREKLFATMKEFSSGGNSFPIIPSGHILFFFFCLAISGGWAISRIRSGLSADGRLSVLCVSAVLLFAALGRCDPFNVALDGCGILLVAAAVVTKRLWMLYQTAFIVFLVVLPTVSSCWLLQRQFALSALRHILTTEGIDRETWLDHIIEAGWRRAGITDVKTKLIRLKRGLQATDGGDSIQNSADISSSVLAPFGYSPYTFSNYHSSKVDLGYFYGTLNAYTPGAVARKVEELKSHPNMMLLLPDKYDDGCKVNAAANFKTIDILFAVPFRERARHEDSLYEPLCRYIDENYRVLHDPNAEGPPYGVWVHR